MRQQDVINMFIHYDVLCDVCRMQMKRKRHTFVLDDLHCESLYVYEGIVKKMLIQYKELMDEALYPVFLYPYIQELRKRYQGYVIVIVPSSQKAYNNRGFSHVEKMFGVLGMDMVCPFVKDDISQKHQSLIMRKRIKEGIHLVNRIPNKPLLLVDDMCTTGSTLLAVYDYLKDHPYPVKALVCCCHAKFVEIRRWK